jgi:membrane-associated phospholipid phosphatase
MKRNPNCVLWIILCCLQVYRVQAQVGDTIVCPSPAAHRWVKPVVAVAYAGGTWLTYRYLDSRIRKASQLNKKRWEDVIFHSASDFGLGKFQTISLVTTSVVAFVSGNKKLERTVITWAGALAINTVTTEILKSSVKRYRPNSGAAYNAFGETTGTGASSFPSAHTSNAFTTATVFATVYKNHKWVPFVAYGLAGLVGLSRIYDNGHWASDVMAGAAIGFLSARAANGLYRVAGKKLAFLPQGGLKSGSLTLVYNF